jgi:putative Mg2+ transporter-C (MgtC) family protein
MIENTEVLLRLVLAVMAGGIIGLERELVHRPAGIRTHMLVCMGSCLFGLITSFMLPNENARIIAGVATGIGFLGAGTIFKSQSEVHGLTTAASIWTTAAVGLGISFGLYWMAFSAVILMFVILNLNKLEFFRSL